MEKKKLTLLVDKEVISKAKKLGLNLSSITESALRISTINNDSDDIVSADKLLKGYQEIFYALSPILKKWGISIEIGGYLDFITDNEGNKHPDHFSYFLNSDRIFLIDEVLFVEEPKKGWKLDDNDIPVHHFNDPELIIRKLIDRLYKECKRNKEKLEKLELVKNILKLSGLDKNG